MPTARESAANKTPEQREADREASRAAVRRLESSEQDLATARRKLAESRERTQK